MKRSISETSLLYNFSAAGHRLPVCSCVWKRCGLTQAVAVTERAFTGGKGSWWGEPEVKGQKDDAPPPIPQQHCPEGRGFSSVCSVRLLYSPHPQTPRERGEPDKHIFTIGEQLWGCLGLDTPLPCMHTHTHAHTHFSLVCTWTGQCKGEVTIYPPCSN